jgi:hypothetical protein
MVTSDEEVTSLHVGRGTSSTQPPSFDSEFHSPHACHSNVHKVSPCITIEPTKKWHMIPVLTASTVGRVKTDHSPVVLLR